MTTDTDSELEEARAAVLSYGYVANEYPITFEQHGDPKMDAVLRRFEQAVIEKLLQDTRLHRYGRGGVHLPADKCGACRRRYEETRRLRELEGQP